MTTKATKAVRSNVRYTRKELETQSMRLPLCPDCGNAMQPTEGHGERLRYCCPKAVGAAFPAGEGRFYFLPDNPHNELRMWTQQDAASLKWCMAELR